MCEILVQQPARVLYFISELKMQRAAKTTSRVRKVILMASSLHTWGPIQKAKFWLEFLLENWLEIWRYIFYPG